MKTKNLIKECGRELFNQHGLMNVTLRDIAINLKKSYGNITYHYATKEVLIFDLFEEMNDQLKQLSHGNTESNLLQYFLKLPADSYEISHEYLFFTLDLLEIKRNYPVVFSKIDAQNNARKEKWFTLLLKLQKEGFLKSELTHEDIGYIMFLSTSVRTAYFQFTLQSAYAREQFVQLVNCLLKPYLTSKGLNVYHKYIK